VILDNLPFDMKVPQSFETSGATHPTTRFYIPEDLNRHWFNYFLYNAALYS
jgi:hypothetical protein